MVVEEEEQLPADFDPKKFNHKFGLIFESVIGFMALAVVLIEVFHKFF